MQAYSESIYNHYIWGGWDIFGEVFYFFFHDEFYFASTFTTTSFSLGQSDTSISGNSQKCLSKIVLGVAQFS